MDESSQQISLGDRIINYSGFILVAASVITFFYLFPSSLSQVGTITGLGPQIFGNFGLAINSALVYLTLAATAILIAAAVVSLFYDNQHLSMGFSRGGKRRYFNFLMIYVLFQLILTEIFAYFAPGSVSGFPFNQTAGVQNFVFSYLTLVESVLFELVPVTVAAIIVAVVKGNFSLRTLTHYGFNRTETALISFVVAFIATAFIGGGILDYFSDFISFVILNVILLRYGFLKAMLTNFTIEITNVTASVISPYPAFGTILSVFLFFLGFLGIYALIQVGTRAPEEVPMERKHEPEVIPEERPRRQRLMEPFVHSRCPDCGNAVYHVLLPGMTLRCTKCGLEMEKDQVGEENKKIEMGNPSRY